MSMPLKKFSLARFSPLPIFTANAKAPSGIGVKVTTNHYGITIPLNDLAKALPWCYAENLPSIVAVHVLNAQPGEVVLDMCSGPGGKSTHIAARTECKVSAFLLKNFNAILSLAGARCLLGESRCKSRASSGEY